MPEDGPGWLAKAGTWLDDYWPRFLQLVGAVAVTLGATLIGLQQAAAQKAAPNKPPQGLDLLSWPWIFLIGGLLAQIVGTVGAWKRTDRLSALRQERDKLKEQQGQAATDYFRQLEKELSYLANDVFKLRDTERVSVYGHEGGAFSMLGRYSQNPVLTRPGRSIYPDDEGCIGRAWANGTAFVDDLPDFEASADEYVARCRNDWGIPPDTVRGFKMKSRTLAAFALEDHTESPRRRFAVLVVESTLPGVLKFDALREAVGPKNELVKFLIKSRPFQPTPGVAREEGF